MKVLETIATVTEDGKMTIQLPPDIPAGEHKVVVIIAKQPLAKKTETNEKPTPLNFPVDNYSS
ncbi:hypothetical protein SD80_013155 [Scytonema tolypothrichoides VB-61278]|nr:hypothetical protein SD80_013155 [Scytonema tolypothrichoides VB-61278]